MLSNVKRMLHVLACIVLLLAVTAGAVYLGVWFFFIGGIVMAIEGAKATPVDGLGIALGIFRVLVAAPIGWTAFIVGAFLVTRAWPR